MSVCIGFPVFRFYFLAAVENSQNNWEIHLNYCNTLSTVCRNKREYLSDKSIYIGKTLPGNIPCLTKYRLEM